MALEQLSLGVEVVTQEHGKAAKYYDRYVNEIAVTLTPAGQSFVTKVGPALPLQGIIDSAIRKDLAGFAPRAKRGGFCSIHGGSHTRAYYESGFANLLASDKLRIARASDIRDLVDRDGETARDLIPAVVGSIGPQYGRPAPRPYNPNAGRTWRR